MQQSSIKKVEDDYKNQKNDLAKITLFQQQSECIEENIPLLFSEDIQDQLFSLCNFTKYLLDHDFILPPNYLERTVELFQRNVQNPEFMSSILFFYRRCTGFPSQMQKFLSDLNIIDLISQFFPQPNVLAILGNLSIPILSNRQKLLSNGILKSLTQLILLNKDENQTIDFEVFDYAVNLINCLVLPTDELDYSQWHEEIVCIFDILFDAYDHVPFEQKKTIIKAFSDYIETDVFFMTDFRDKGYLRKFFEVDFPDQDDMTIIYLSLIDICRYIVHLYQNEGAQFLFDIQIVNWMSLKLFHPSEKVRMSCYSLLSFMIQNIIPSFPLINECIDNEFVISSIDKLQGNSKYQLKVNILEFLCSLFTRASNSKIIFLIQEKVLEVILNHFVLFEEELDKVHLILESILRLRQFMDATMPNLFEEEEIEENQINDLTLIEEQINTIRENDEFLEWIDEIWEEAENSPDQEDSLIQTLLVELDEIKTFLNL